MASVCRFLTTRLQLKVNESKSAVARSGERKFLGFTISNDPEPTRQIAAKALEKFKERVRELTCRTLGVSVPQLIAPLARYLIGWRGYFGFCQTPIVLRNLDAWIRRRLRMYIWRQWKNGRTRYAQLRRLGVSHFHAAHRCRDGVWVLAHGSPCDGAAGPAQRVLRLDRPSSIGGTADRLTRSNRRGTDPYARWCGRGGAARLPPIPISAQRRTHRGERIRRGDALAVPGPPRRRVRDAAQPPPGSRTSSRTSSQTSARRHAVLVRLVGDEAAQSRQDPFDLLRRPGRRLRHRSGRVVPGGGRLPPADPLDHRHSPCARGPGANSTRSRATAPMIGSPSSRHKAGGIGETSRGGRDRRFRAVKCPLPCRRRGRRWAIEPGGGDPESRHPRS